MSVFHPNNPNDKAAIVAALSHIHCKRKNHLVQENNSMRKILFPSVVIALLFFFVIGLIKVFTNPISNGIVGIPNWNHGILLCGEENDESLNKRVDKATGSENHYWNDQYGAWTVNAGHLADPELKELKRVAKFTCPYNKEGVGATHNHLITNDGEKVKLFAVSDSTYMEETPSGMSTDPAKLAQHMESCDHDFNVILVKESMGFFWTLMVLMLVSQSKKSIMLSMMTLCLVS